MFFRAIAGLVAGLAAGAISGIMYLLMSVPDIYGFGNPLLSLIAHLVGSDDVAVGWSFNLFCSTMVGVIYGLFAGPMVRSMPRALLSGLIAGLAFWGVSALVLLPLLGGTTGVMYTVTTTSLGPIGLGLLIGSSVFGVLMGAVFLLLYRPIDIEERKLAEQELEQQRILEEHYSSVR